MDLHRDWPEIRRLFARTFYASIASVTADGHPHVSPIGSLILDREPGRGFWFERFTTGLPRHLEADPRLCVLAVDTRLSLWLPALLKGSFPRAPGVRLTGCAGQVRKASARETEIFQKQVSLVRRTRGYQKLWSTFDKGREVHFEAVLPIRLGRMWPPRPS